MLNRKALQIKSNYQLTSMYQEIKESFYFFTLIFIFLVLISMLKLEVHTLSLNINLYF